MKIVEKLISMSKNENIQDIIREIRNNIGQNMPLAYILQFVKFRKITDLDLILQQQI